MISRFLFLSLFFSTISVFAVDPPGGLLRIAEGHKSNSYEVFISPSYVLSPSGAYMTSEFRYQNSEDFGTGFSFGAGEVGYNFGANATWFISPDLPTQPGFSVTGGMYLNRLKGSSYFVTRITPTVSKRMPVVWGNLVPYTGLHLAPSFRLGDPANEFSAKWAVGNQFSVKSMNGMNFWTELDLALNNSVHELVFGVSYPL